MIYPKEYMINGVLWDVDYTMNEGSDENKRQFLQRIYNQYVSIRTVVGGQKCRKAGLDKVKTLLAEPDMLTKVKNTLGYDEKQVNLIIFLAENEIPFVR